jgi:aminoglycoside phosphotransferase (APT) family kinase protein
MHDLAATPERLARFLSDHEAGRHATVVGYVAMVGGYSRVMARADVEWSDGTREALVLRGDPPPGRALIETYRDTELELLAALSASGEVPMPALRHYDATGERLGTKCIVLEFVDGRSLQATLDAVPVGEHRDLRRGLVDTMARIHSIDLDERSLPLPRPTDWSDYLGGLIDRFRQADRDYAESVPFLRYVGAWLDAHRPPALPLRVVHGDFQAANIMVDATGELLMIDWELAHIGDPREDLGYYNVYSSASGPNQNLFLADPEGFLARYRERTGFSEEAVNMATMVYFSALAAIALYARMLAATAALARGTNAGLMTTYNINALTIGHGNFIAGCSAPPTKGTV